MSDRSEWTLGRVRAAYREILGAYNELFPLHPQTRGKSQDVTALADLGENDAAPAVPKKMTASLHRIKESADCSGNAVTWRRGDPLEGLSPGIQERIRKALELGI